MNGTKSLVMKQKLDNQPRELIEDSGGELTDIQLQIVNILLDKECSAAECAKIVGCHWTYVHKTLNKQHVRRFILEQVSTRLLMSAPKAASIMQKLLSSRSDYVKYQAATDILDRVGIKSDRSASHHSEVKVTIDLS